MCIRDRLEAKHTELYDHLEHGIYVDLMAPSVWDEPEDSIRCLMEADNLDQAIALPDHELVLLRNVFSELRLAQQAPSPWDAVWLACSQRGTGAFSREDHMAAFKLARTLGAVHLDALETFHFHFANPTALNVEPALFAWAAEIEASCPYCKGAVIARAYMVDPKHFVSFCLLYTSPSPRD